ncbi:unnamed protein product [Darwinula stevensoni]|uniref:N-acetylgalactosaminide beta-1,3-galactosyltransferase n=1 Tax=Darwinula stevensoni TaxID=69355 RepID=A0A7R8XBP5_9CRUS|nr:unnamed protein product [Darwinula stevensoni]CAG0886869.1 unnamed protein product [Darwinula stevensoni]
MARGYRMNRNMIPNGNALLVAEEGVLEMSQRVRVLCAIMTHPRNHEKKAKHVRDTWGKRCDVLLFMSSVEDPSLPTVALKVKEGRQHLSKKTHESFRYIYQHHLDDADWFLKADDDTYVVMENLRFMLHDRNRKCLNFVGVQPGDTRDELGRWRFLPFAPETHLNPGFFLGKYDWLWKHTFYPYREGPECCSDKAIAFHYISPNLMHALEYFTYRLHPFGVQHQPLVSNDTGVSKSPP